ncbi:MAG TPA: hypothetical protein VLH39_02350, partial [Magnetospirillaceae bacterium]|nr:hypothetical protein [Magnetospirillaceae bacterium]
LLEQAAAPCICAVGVALVFRSGDFNLGGEGQAYAGGTSAVMVLLVLPALPGAAGIAAGLAFGAAAGALVVLPSALSRRFAGAGALLSSFLVSAAVVLVLDWGIAGPLRDPESNLIATRLVPDIFRLPRLIPPSSLSFAPILAVAAAVGLDHFLRRTRRGMELSLYGRNPLFAASIGFAVRSYAFWPLAASGALNGLAGALLAMGSNGRAVRGMTGGIGWDGISIALLAGKDPRWIVPAALFFSWLETGSRQASILAGVSADVGTVAKALVLLLATARLARGGRAEGRA